MAPKRKRQRLSAEAASVARKKLREMRANEIEAEASGTIFSHSQSELVEASTSLLTTSAATEISNIVTETSVPDSVAVPATVTSSLASEAASDLVADTTLAPATGTSSPVTGTAAPSVSQVSHVTGYETSSEASTLRLASEIVCQFSDDWVMVLDSDDRKSLAIFLCHNLAVHFNLNATESSKIAALMIDKSDRTVRQWRTFLNMYICVTKEVGATTE